MLIGFGLLLAGSGAAIYLVTRVSLVREFDAGLRAKAVTIMSLAQQGEDGLQVDMPDGLRNIEMPQYFELWQTNGTLCLRSASLQGSDLPFRFGAPPAPAIWNLKLPNGRHGRAIALKFQPETDDEDGPPAAPTEAVLVVAGDRQSLDQTLNILAAVLGMTGLLTILVTVPLVKFSLRRGHASLDQLATRAAAINASSLSARFPEAALPEELQPIAICLNDLLRRLETSFERERRFSADLAHELRTPLAELRALAEVELTWSDGKPLEEHRATLDIALRMSALVERLLELARSETGKISLHLEPVPLLPLVEEIWRPLAPKANARQLAFHRHVPAGTMLETDPALLRSILTNLLGNAVEYAPPNGQVEVRWHDDLRLSISNSVQDLTEADIPHLFERMWRKDKSRTGNEHCGLGLTLSRTFAGLLGYHLTAHFENGNRLTISLATAPRSSQLPN